MRFILPTVVAALIGMGLRSADLDPYVAGWVAGTVNMFLFTLYSEHA